MATRRLMTDRGEEDKDVTEAVGAANVTKNIELTFNLATVTAKQDVLFALKRFERYILSHKWPLA